MAMDKILHLTRHAQAEHNVDDDVSIRDAKLTPLGHQQSRALNDLTSSTYQTTSSLLVSSIQRRPLQTMILGYPSLLSRLSASGKPPIILDILQEANEYPCDIPTSPLSALVDNEDAEVKEMFQVLDWSDVEVHDGWDSKEGIYAVDRVEERAERVRRWLFEREEREIVVVAHGDILRLIADAHRSDRQWDNAENKNFTFASDDMSQPLKEIVKGDVEPRNATEAPTSSESA